MEIIGYSERGAMNALFYGMALKNDDEAMKTFLDKAGFQIDDYIKFELFVEFSLSEFGSPDLVIFADKKSNQKEVFFVEAKASCCKTYELADQKDMHDKYIKEGYYDDGHASNLFFQLRLKNYFYQLKEWFCLRMEGNRPITNIKDDKEGRIRNTRRHERNIGRNAIVRKFVGKFKDCTTAHYIAIIPEQINDRIGKDYGFHIHYISWEEIFDLFKDRKGYKSLKQTFAFNQGIDTTIKSEDRIVSQILNKPIPEL